MVFPFRCVITATLFVLTAGGLGNEFLRGCDNGWAMFRDQLGGETCILPVTKRLPWQQARRNCQAKVAHLANFDMADQYVNVRGAPGNTTETFGEYLLSYSTLFWSGMNINNETGRLMWDDYSPKYVIKNRFQNTGNWDWGQGQPSVSEGNFCGKFVLNTAPVEGFGGEGSGTFSTTTQNPDSPQRFDRFLAEMRNCEDSLPYICQKPSFTIDVKTVSNCEDGWVGNVYFPYCFRIFKDFSTYDDAIKNCNQMGGQLAPENMTQQFFKTVVAFTQNNDAYFQENRISLMWVDFGTQPVDREGVQFCNAYISGDVTSTPCDTTLPYMCITKPMETSEDVEVSLISDYLDPEKLVGLNPFSSLPISGMFSRPPLENEIFGVRTPLGFMNSSASFAGDTLERPYAYSVNVSSRTDRPYSVNLTLLRSQGGAARKRSVHEDIYQKIVNFIRQKRGFQGIFSLTEGVGYYSFAVYSFNPFQVYSTEPELIRPSEQFLLIYVVYETLGDQLGLTDVNKFNLMQLEEYVGYLREVAQSPYQTDLKRFLVSNSAFVFEHVDLEMGIVKIRFFFTIFGRNNITASEEQQILVDFQENFIESNSMITVYSTVACPLLSVTNREGVTVTFPSTRAGNLAYSWQRCIGGSGARAQARCEGGYKDGAKWGTVEYRTGCQAVTTSNTSSSTSGLQELAEVTLIGKNETEVTGVINNTTILTAPDVTLTRDDVIYTADILYNTLTSGVSSTEILEGSLNITNNILSVNKDIINDAQEIDNAANRIIQSIDDLTAAVDLMGQTSVRIVRQFVAALVWEQDGGTTGDIIIGIQLSEKSTVDNVIDETLLDKVQKADDVINPSTDAAIYLPREIYKGRTKSSFHIYSNTDLFTVLNGRFAINSKVAAARLSVNSVPVVDLGDNTVTAVFSPIQKTSDHIVCGYWNYTANEDAGGWATTGCTTARDGDKVVCKCNHLTNFAVLIDLEAERISDKDKQILSIITKVGLIISIIGLGLTVLTFLIFKHLRKGRGQQVLVNLSVAMLCSSIIFLVGMDKVENRAGCKAVAVLLHYFILVSFMWMLVEGVLQYLRFVKVLGTYIPSFMIKSMLPAWGLPLIPVIIVLAIDHDLYYRGEEGFCWLQYAAMLYAFIVPVAIVMLANIIIFLTVMFKLLCRKNKSMSSNQSESKMAFLHFRAAVSVFVILGLTWVFGFLAMTDARIVFHYLFAVLNAFQGFFIFLLFTFRERQIRKAWRDLCCKKRRYKSTDSASDSKTRKYSATPYTDSTGLDGSEKSSKGHAEFQNPVYD